MHYYDCPCDECRRGDSDTLYQRVLHVIERLEQELERPRIKEHDRALQWLESVCGGPQGVQALDDRPLHEPVLLPDDARAVEVARLLRTVAEKLFDAETGVAFQHGLGRLWAHDPGLVTAPVSPAYVAAGLAWAVGEANGAVGSDCPVTSARLKHALQTPSSPATYARPIRKALRGPWEWRADEGPRVWMAAPLPSLSALGHLDLLTARTRRQLLRVREHALAAQAADRERAA